MKWIAAILASAFTVSLYMIFFNHTSNAWFPLVYCLLVPMYLYADRRIVLFGAVSAGVMMDMHFHYFGVYTALYAVAVGILAALEGFFAKRDNGASIVTGTALVSLWSIGFLFIVSGILNGFQYYYAGTSSFASLFFLVLRTWLVIAAVCGIVRALMSFYTYARR